MVDKQDLNYRFKIFKAKGKILIMKKKGIKKGKTTKRERGQRKEKGQEYRERYKRKGENRKGEKRQISRSLCQNSGCKVFFFIYMCTWFEKHNHLI